MLLLVLSAALVATACGDGAPRVPTGDPLTVVQTSAERTPRAGLLRVIVTGPEETLDGEVRLVSGTGPSEIRERALAALDVARWATKAVAYGGQQVRGVSTMRYEVTAREGGRVDVWVDVEGFARRIQLPDGPLDGSPPPVRDNGLPGYVTVDFVVVARPQLKIAPGGPDL
ncbi:MAG TPA: hypothetical protein VMY88_01330 [Acidimicrobiales bacterium]|nr:hypothetical protein [Acidimicrobiales bacterium]